MERHQTAIKAIILLRVGADADGDAHLHHYHHYHHYHYHYHHHHHHLCGDAHVVVEGELVAVEHGRPGEPVRLHPALAPRPHCLNTQTRVRAS